MKAAVPPRRAVRLHETDRAGLAAVFDECLGAYPDAVVYLFGSRTDPEGRGGDIDLLVVSERAARQAYELSMRLRIAIKDRLGDQKVDVLVSAGGTAGEAPIVRLALLEGVRIWP